MEIEWWRLKIYEAPAKKIGQVWDTLGSPCSVSPGLWVAAGFAALPTFALSLIKPEIVEVNLEKRGRRHLKWRRFAFKIFDLQGPQITIRGAPTWVRLGYNTAERLGWYLLVVDATTDFAVNWTSMAYRFSGCQVPNQPYCIQFAITQTTVNGQAFYPLWSGVTNGPEGIAGNNQLVTVFSEVTATFFASAIPHPNPDFPQQFVVDAILMEIVEVDTDFVLASQLTEKAPDGSLNAGVVYRNWVQNNLEGNYRVRITTIGPSRFGRIRNVRLETLGQDQDGLLPDP